MKTVLLVLAGLGGVVVAAAVIMKSALDSALDPWGPPDPPRPDPPRPRRDPVDPRVNVRSPQPGAPN